MNLTHEQIIAIAEKTRTAESRDGDYILPISFAEAIVKANDEAFDRATEAGAPAKAVQMPERWDYSSMMGRMEPRANGGFYLAPEADSVIAARAEEARREADAAHHRALVKTEMEARNAGYAEGLAAAQRTAGGDDIAVKIVAELNRLASFEDPLNRGTLEWAASEIETQFVYGKAPEMLTREELALTGVQCVGTSGLVEDGNTPVLEPCGACGYGEPVAEAAAQADDWTDAAPKAQPTPPSDRRPRISIIGDSFSRVMPMSQWYAELAAAPIPSLASHPRELTMPAAPTAQPTPPDDELKRAIEGAIRKVTGWPDMKGNGLYLVSEICAALRHPPVPNVGALRDALVKVDSQLVLILNGADGPVYSKLKAARNDLVRIWLPLDKGDEQTPAAQPTEAGADPAAAATIDTEEFRSLLWAYRNDAISKLWQRSSALVAHIDAAIAAAREERKAAADANYGAIIRDLQGDIADLRARLTSAGAGVDYRRIAEDWCEVAVNGLQWIRNIADKPALIPDALANMKDCVDSLHAKYPDAFAARQDSAAEDKGGA